MQASRKVEPQSAGENQQRTEEQAEPAPHTGRDGAHEDPDPKSDHHDRENPGEHLSGPPPGDHGDTRRGVPQNVIDRSRRLMTLMPA